MRTARVATFPLALALVITSAGVRARAIELPAAVATASPTPGPPALATPAAAQTSVFGLREIGRVRVATPFCTTLRESTTVAADSAVTFETSALVTLADIIRFGHASTMMEKYALDRRVDDDLRSLTDLTREGGAELAGLKVLASTSTPEQRTQLLGLRDSLDGAKVRQHVLTKKLAILDGEMKGRPPAGVDDVVTSNFLSSISNGDTGIALDAQEKLEALMPDNDDAMIRTDLGAAAAHAQNAVDLGNCSTDHDGEPPPAPLREMTPSP